MKNLKSLPILKNSEIYKAGKWLVNALAKRGKERKVKLLEKDLVHKENYNEDIVGLRDVVIEQKQGLEKQTNNGERTIKALESKIDNLKGQLISVQEYITNKDGKKRWDEIVSYIKSQEQQRNNQDLANKAIRKVYRIN